MANWASLESIRNESSFFRHSSNASPPPPSHGQSLDSRISPSILLIIVILAVIFFISGLLHLLVRFLVKPSRRENDDLDDVSALQGQLQQLFHLHDAGLDQSFIDALPVFLYKTIIGVKNPFDCAVCLCEFEEEDKLRLLPKCSHAFHLECIDTWLLSHSTCPLCRGSLLPDLQSNCCSPIVLVLESRSGSSRETTDGDSISSARLDLSSSGDLIRVDNSEKPVEKNPSREETEVVSVKLGKLRNVIDGVGVLGSSVRVVGEGSSHLTTVDSRRCYSMGYFEYVLDEASLLQVPIAPMKRKRLTKKPKNPSYGAMAASCRLADSAIVRQGRRESFSISKIWLRSKRERVDPLRRAFSYRLPLQRVDDMKELSCSQRTTVSEIEVEGWVNGYDRVGSSSVLPTSDENGLDGKRDCHSFHSIDAGLQRNPTPPSFARRTLHWIVGRSQNRVMHSAPLPPSSLI